MRILFYINTLYGGGAERVLANLANQFSRHGYDVCVVTTIQNPEDYPLDKGVKRITLMSGNEFFRNVISKNFFLIIRLNRTIKEFKPVVAISFMGEPNFRLLACQSLTRKIISIRSDPKYEYHGIRGFITKKMFYRSHGIVCQTTDVLNWLKPSIRKRGKVIFNQVNPSFYNTNHLSSEYYVATGRLNQAKNYELMINSFHEFIKIYPDAKLFIYGEGALKNELQNIICCNGDEHSIFLQGSSNCIPDVLSHAKAFILTSNYEGMPNGLLEAMSVGLPCISTDCPCGGPRTIIKNGINGILIPVGDKEALVRALCMIEEDSEISSRMGVAAKNTAKMFEPSKVFDEWRLFVEQIAFHE